MNTNEGVLGSLPQSSTNDGAADGEAAYEQAAEMMDSKLYDENIADGIGEAIMLAPDKVAAVVEQALTLAALVDDATGATLPDDMVMLFGMEVLGEVAEIADQVGVKLSASDMAAASRQFITEAITNMGGDTRDVDLAMRSVGDDKVGALLEEAESREA